MKRVRSLWVAIVATSVVVPGGLAAQRTVTPERESVFPEPFSNIVGVRELEDGRVMIADRLEQHVSVINFRNGDVNQIGREGQGPGEYSTPMGLHALPGGSTLLSDMGNMRLSIIDADHRFGDTYPMMRQEQGMIFVRPQGTDRNGQVYFSMEGMMMAGPGGSPARPDSGAVIRMDLETDQMDTVAMLALPTVPRANGGSQVRMSSGGESFNMSAMMPPPFSPRDAWAIANDGSVVVARANQYRVDRFAPDGSSTIGSITEFDRVRITQEVKDRWADERGSMQASLQTAGGESRTMQMERPDTEGVDFPEFLPPFDGGQVSVAADGRAWVRLNVRPGGPVRYDVFGVDGERAMQVQFPARTNVVGFGDGVVYAVSVDEDDLQWLGRYKI
jgi:hypothetical protein